MNQLNKTYIQAVHLVSASVVGGETDVVFNEDGCRARKDYSPENLNVLRKIALARLRTTDGGKRVSTSRKMLRASLNPDFLYTVLFGG